VAQEQNGKQSEEHTINPDFFYETPEKFKKQLEQKKKNFKQTIKQYLPEPAQKMLDSTEGTIALIAIAFVILVVLFKVVGLVFNLAFRLIFIVAVIVIIYFLYTYFTGGG